MALIILGLILLFVSILGGTSGLVARFKALFRLGAVIIIIVGVLTASLKQIDPGHVGVQVLFGNVQSGILYEGLHLINPLVDVKEMTIQTQNYTMSAVRDEGNKVGDDAIRVLSKDGLEVIIDLTVLYKVKAEKAPEIFQAIGLDYQDKIIRPLTRTKIRENAVYFDAIELFSGNRQDFEARIKNSIQEEFLKRGLILENLLVRNINLPQSVKESIERKITAVQDAQRMEYVLQKEKQEAERKRVEAQGVADAQRIVNEGLSDRVLQFEAIKMQKELVNSPNSKIIIMGNSKGNTPFIIGNQ